MRITRTEFAKIALITIFGYGGTAVLLFSSYNFIPSGMSTTIHFMYPVFTILGCMIFFKENNLFNYIFYYLCPLFLKLCLQ